jgi:tetratricopeptide (TPR) repeat protein
MINSPRILARGYDYRDTLSHELVHFLIYQRFQEAVPIWLHEGIAKSLEERWRSDAPVGELAPSQQSLLASALRMNELIGFDRMHPSFAKLKTPRQGQLAFAEVSTAVKWMVHQGGWPLVFKICEELKKSPDYRTAVERATGLSFDRFWTEWTAYAKGLGYQELPGMEISVYEIRKDDGDEDDEDVLEEDMNEGEEWKYVRLGDLLRDRGHYQAATVEYRKAREIAPYTPRILNKLGLCYYLAGDLENSIEPLAMAVKMMPGYSTSYVNLGRAYLGLKRHDEARRALESSLDINPFNPIPYNLLAEILDQQEDREGIKRLARDYAIIRGLPAPQFKPDVENPGPETTAPAQEEQ